MRVSDISSVIIMISSRTGSIMADITEAVQLSTALAVPAVVVAVADMVNVVVTVNTTEARGVVVIMVVGHSLYILVLSLLWYDGSEGEGNEGQLQGEEEGGSQNESVEDAIIVGATGPGVDVSEKNNEHCNEIYCTR